MAERLYTLLTGNSGLRDNLDTNPRSGTGWRLQGELVDDKSVADNQAVLNGPDGAELGRVTLNQFTMNDVKALILQDLKNVPQASQHQGALPDDPAARTRYKGTTGHKVAAQMLKSYDCPPERWSLEVDYYQGMATEHIQLLNGDTVIGAGAVLPIHTLVSRIAGAIREYRAGVLGAASEINETLRPPEELPADPAPAVPEQTVAASAQPVEATPAAAVTPPVPEPAEPAPRKVPAPVVQGDTLLQIPISEVGHFPGGNIREQFEDLDDLAASIRTHGIMQPITVNERDGRYTLIAGERRLRAAGKAGLDTVPCRVMQLDDQTALELMLIENLQRRDLNPIEEAKAYQRLMQIPGATQGSVAERVGKSRVHVVEYLQLLELTGDLQYQVATGVQSVKNGLAFLRQTKAAPPEVKQEVARAMTEQQPTSREAPKLIDRVLEQQGVARATPQPRQEHAPAPPTPPSAPPAPAQPPAPQPAPGPEPAPPVVEEETEIIYLTPSVKRRFQALRVTGTDSRLLTALMDDWEAFNR